MILVPTATVERGPAASTMPQKSQPTGAEGMRKLMIILASVGLRPAARMRVRMWCGEEMVGRGREGAMSKGR